MSNDLERQARALADAAVLQLLRPIMDELSAQLPALVDRAVREIVETERLEPEPYLTIAEASAASNLGETKLRELCTRWESGDADSGVRCLRLDKGNHRSTLFVTRSWIDEWAERQSEQTPAPKRAQMRRKL